MLASLVPPCAITAVADSVDWESSPLAAEAVLVADAVYVRRREFAAGRSCARRALAGLGVLGYAVLAGPRREPVWPRGVVGSITHCAGYCAAVVAPDNKLAAVGIDAAVNSQLPEEVLALTCIEHELESAGSLPNADTATLVFSAKESVFKAWYPLTGRWLDHLDARIWLDLSARRFTVELLDSAPRAQLPGTLEGRFHVSASHVLTAVVVSHSPAHG